ncbi:hypothetical protein [Pseudonocardia acaciae]|uniref:hypothetical protein n=1 Tax=Pseudonocardia acaciae TaxID=551276 RepID=UPI000568A566|nr:hypothetical protein [Pseudonocardia acaciae]
MTSAWPDAVEEILDGDLAVALAQVTPARGVVLTPITNFALRDRGASTVTVLSSLGAWRKLDRMRRDPRVALAFHTRAHGFTDRPEFVLVQGTASFSARPDRAWLESIEDTWVRFMGPRELGPVWDRWMRVYHWERVGVRIAVRRVTVWPDLECLGEPATFGAPPCPDSPSAQREPAMGTAPRVDPVKAAARATRLPHRLLAWVDADGFPFVVPVGSVSVGSVSVGSVSGRPGGVALSVPPGLAPAGGRRAGLLSHWFSPGVLGQRQHGHTGWLAAEPGACEVGYAPHTHAGYHLPPSRLLYRALVGGFARRGLRQARRAGFVDGPVSR